MDGVLLYAAAFSFAAGVEWRTLFVISWPTIGVELFIGLLVMVGAWVLGKRRMLVVGTVLCVCAIGMARTSCAPVSLPHQFTHYLNHSASFIGTIIADPDIREKNQQLIVDVSERNIETRILVFAPLTSSYEYGERVQISGELTQPTPFATDTGRTFRYDHYLAKKQIFALIMRGNVTVLGPPVGAWSWFADFLFYIKHIFMRGLTRALPHPFDALADGLLTGNQHQIGDTFENMLAMSGLVWVVVLSGYHVMVIAEAILKLGSWLPGRIRFIAAGICIAMVVFATGASAPSLRGGTMASFTLFARATNRTYDSLRALCVTLIIILLWNPLLLAYDQGFELSLVVTPALIICTPLLEMRLLWIKSKLLREIITVSTVAQLSLLPLLLWQNGQLGIWAIPANMFVMSLVPISMFFSVIAGVAGMVLHHSAALSLIGFPAYAVLYYILWIAKTALSLPYAATIIPPFSFVWVVMTYAALACGVWWLKKSSNATPLHSRNASRQHPT